MGPFPADDDPHAGRPAGGGEVAKRAGQFGDVGTVTEFTVGLDRRRPRCLRQREDGRLDRGGHGEPDREPQVQTLNLADPAQMSQPRLGRAGTVGADQDRGAVPMRVGDLRQCPVGDGDVIGGGVVG